MNKTVIAIGLASVLAVGAAAFTIPRLFSSDTPESGAIIAPQTTEQTPSTTTTSTTVVAPSSLRNVMYYGDWSIWSGQGNYYPQDLPAHLYTHLNFAFLDFDSAGNLMFTDTDAATGANLGQEGVTWGDVNGGILSALRVLREENPNVKLGVSVGGWSKSGDFPTMAANDSTRANFVSNMMQFLEYTNFDFVDIDWEYPGVVRQPDYTDNQRDEGNPSATASDKENYIKLLQELRLAMEEQGARLGKTYELSVALPMDQEKLAVGVDIPAMFELVDFANIMTYDARGAFDAFSGHHTPLYGNPSDPYYDKGYSVDQSVNYLLAQGAVANKIVIGAAFYSRGWENIENVEVVSGMPGLFANASTGLSNADGTESVGALNDVPLAVGDGGMAGGVWAYRNFDNLKAAYPNLVEYWDDVAKAPYLYNGAAFFTYDNPQSLQEKANYVLAKGLGGMITWQASNDAVTSTPNQRDLLTQVIYDGLYQGATLAEHAITTATQDVSLTISSYQEEWGNGGLEFTLKNNEMAQETSAVLRSVELQQETIQLPKLYIACSGILFQSGGYGSGTVTQEGSYTVVDLAEVYENKLIPQGQSVTFRLQCAEEVTAEVVTSVTMTQRVTTAGTECSSQVIYSPLEGTVVPEGATGSGTTSQTTGGESSTQVTPPVNTSGVLVWNREDEAKGVYTPGVQVSHNGVIYVQVAEGTLWWDEPTKTSEHWQVIGEVEGYEGPAPTAWTREAEAVGTYTTGAIVSHNGKTYEQVSQSTAWWCEPGTDDTVWRVIS